MRGKYLQTRVATGRSVLPVSILITVLCWVVTYFLVPDMPRPETTYRFWEIVASFTLPDWVHRVFSLLLYLTVGYLLILLNNTFAIIRIRASVQTTFYLLFITACPAMHLLYAGDVATLAFTVALFLLFKTYQHPNPPVYIFHSFLFVGLGSLVFPQLTLFTPVLFLGMSYLQSLTPRSFFAAVIGWSVPYWFLFGHAFFYDNMEMFYQPFIELATFQPIDFDSLELWEIVTLGYYFILFLVSSVYCFVESYKDKIRTRIYLRFLILLNICIFAFIILQPVHYINLLSLLLVGVSILTGHMFALTDSKASNIFFISVLVGLIGLFLFNLWTLL